MAPHSSTLAWKIPRTEEPGRLQSMGVTKSRTWLRDFTFTFHFHALEKEMATHSHILAWRIPGMGEPGGLPSVGSHRVGHDWSDLAAAKINMIRHIKSNHWKPKIKTFLRKPEINDMLHLKEMMYYVFKKGIKWLYISHEKTKMSEGSGTAFLKC